MDLIVPIAGTSSRFKNHTSTPKWALMLGDKYVLQWALSSFEESPEVRRIFLVVKERDGSQLEAVLRARSSKKETHIVYLTEGTDGQARTVYQGLMQMPDVHNFLVWNCDSHLTAPILGFPEARGNFFAISELEGDHWSFAREHEGEILETREKVRISNWASIGLYGWADPETFSECLSIWDEKSSKEESYVAPLYNFAISRGIRVASVKVPRNLFIPMGTPDELIAAANLLNVSITDTFGGGWTL